MPAKPKHKVIRKVSRRKPKQRPVRSANRRPMRVLMRLLGGGLFAAVVGWCLLAGYHYLITSSYFVATQIDINGHNYLDRETVLEQAQIKAPVNILEVNLALVRKRLLAHPWVKEARLSRTIPNRLEIRLVEQQPIAIVRADRDYLINRGGEAFDYVKPHQRYRLPQIEGLSARHLALDGGAPDPSLGSILELLEATRASGWRKVYPRIKVDPLIGLSLVEKKASHKVLLGFDRYPRKLTLLGKVREYLKRHHGQKSIALIDVTQLDRVVVRSQPPLTAKIPLKEA